MLGWGTSVKGLFTALNGPPIQLQTQSRPLDVFTPSDFFLSCAIQSLLSVSHLLHSSPAAVVSTSRLLRLSHAPRHQWSSATTTAVSCSCSTAFTSDGNNYRLRQHMWSSPIVVLQTPSLPPLALQRLAAEIHFVFFVSVRHSRTASQLRRGYGKGRYGKGRCIFSSRDCPRESPL